MTLYRKKPVVIEAVEFTYPVSEELKKFLGNNLGRVSKNRHPEAKAEAEIKTLEDGCNLTVKHIATEGDYIIKGVQGEYYACKPDIFFKTYDLAE